ncbi:MAG: M20/M25/M40 family metallo-hydrolase [Legionella sp.]|uniref:aminopeptidase LapA n=1 Tax=Legionella sp. TaxID=459 RepID=UPI0039E2AD66
MRLNQWKACIAASSILVSTSIYAVTPIREQFQVPQCLAQKITMAHEVLAENNQFKIIDISSADVDSLSHLADKIQCGRYVNVSHHITGSLITEKRHFAQNILQMQIKPLSVVVSDNVTYEIKHQNEVNAALKNIVADNIWQALSHLTAYENRSATKNTGVEAANWLKTSFEALATEYGRTDTATYFVATGHYKQPSLVTVIGKNINAPGIVIGAHMDTLDGHMPGAGDDGSGSATVMEMARVLLSSNIQFKRPIYVIWYAAEERGLVGSQYVVDYFQKHFIPVKAAIQFDMTGYRIDPNDSTMWVFTDYVDRRLSNYVAKLIDTYVKVPVGYSRCGYGCSDHASWHNVGVPAAFPCESNFEDHNPYIHSPADTMSLLSLEHMTNFSKLAVAFAIELASE